MRSWRTRALILGALVVSLSLGGALLVVDALRPSPSDALDHPADPVTDGQSQAQVVEAAKQIVGLAELRTASAGYLLMSCKNRNDPPYQGAVYLTFTLPTGAAADKYFATIVNTLSGNGWAESSAPTNRMFGRTITRDGVTGIVYRDDDNQTMGVLRLYGQCRNVNDHRRDDWTDITAQVTRN